MRYEDPELIDRLAASFVLGTLRGPARRRFKRLAQESMVIQHAVWDWERRLTPMAEQSEPREPPARTWQSVEERLGFAAPRRRATWLWPGLSVAFALAFLALLLPPYLLPREPALTPAERLALIQDSEQQPLWVVTVDEESGQLSTIAVNVPAKEADRVFELWMLPATGAPESFGLLPTVNDERSSRRLSPALLALLADASGIAVSLEPAGGSPTGTPTGPVLFTAPVIGI